MVYLKTTNHVSASVSHIMAQASRTSWRKRLACAFL